MDDFYLYLQATPSRSVEDNLGVGYIENRDPSCSEHEWCTNWWDANCPTVRRALELGQVSSLARPWLISIFLR